MGSFSFLFQIFGMLEFCHGFYFLWNWKQLCTFTNKGLYQKFEFGFFRFQVNPSPVKFRFKASHVFQTKFRCQVISVTLYRTSTRKPWSFQEKWIHLLVLPLAANGTKTGFWFPLVHRCVFCETHRRLLTWVAEKCLHRTYHRSRASFLTMPRRHWYRQRLGRTNGTARGPLHWLRWLRWGPFICHPNPHFDSGWCGSGECLGYFC